MSEVSKVRPISAYHPFRCPARDQKSSPQMRRNVAKYFQQRSWFGEKFVPQTAYLSSEDNKYTAELSFGSSRNTISWKGLLTSTEIRIKLFTRRRILSADINLRSGPILAVLVHSLSRLRQKLASFCFAMPAGM